jgi:hypothetical protein
VLFFKSFIFHYLNYFIERVRICFRSARFAQCFDCAVCIAQNNIILACQPELQSDEVVGLHVLGLIN